MKTIILVHHTESEHHINGHIGAWQDWNLTAKGREQAFRIGEWLKQSGCDKTWSMFVSPQRRAIQTAEENGIGSTQRLAGLCLIRIIRISLTRNQTENCGTDSCLSIWT